MRRANAARRRVLHHVLQVSEATTQNIVSTAPSFRLPPSRSAEGVEAFVAKLLRAEGGPRRL
jgi:hypothetical protein